MEQHEVTLQLPLVTRHDDGDTITAGDMETVVCNTRPHILHNKLLTFALSGDFTAENK